MDSTAANVQSMQYDAMKKSVGVAFLFWFFLGGFGAHRFYLKHTGTAIAMLIITVVSIPLTLVIVGFIGLAAVGIWWIVDAFLISGMVEKYNLDLADRFK